MKLRSPLPKKRTRLEIIPLIDIMFFLLASFMLVSLSMSKQRTIKVNLPTAVTAKNDVKPDMISLAVDADGAYYLDKHRLDLAEMEKALAKRHEETPEAPVSISGDNNSRHGSMVRLLDAVRRSGFEKIAFQVKEMEPNSNSAAGKQ